MTSLRAFTSALAVLLCLSLAACHHHHKRTYSGPAVTGTIVYLTNVVLPMDAQVELKLVELNRDGTVVRVIAEDTLPRPRSIPLDYVLPYSRRDIIHRAVYGVDARIVSGGKALFATPRPTPVLTHGNPSNTEVVLEPVK